MAGWLPYARIIQDNETTNTTFVANLYEAMRERTDLGLEIKNNLITEFLKTHRGKKELLVEILDKLLQIILQQDSDTRDQALIDRIKTEFEMEILRGSILEMKYADLLKLTSVEDKVEIQEVFGIESNPLQHQNKEDQKEGSQEIQDQGLPDQFRIQRGSIPIEDLEVIEEEHAQDEIGNLDEPRKSPINEENPSPKLSPIHHAQETDNNTDFQFF